MLTFEIPGKTKAKQSFKIGKEGFKYTPADVKSYANWVRLCFMQKYPEHLPSVFYDKSLMVEIDANMAIPKSFSKNKRELALGGFIRPQVKPDCDNIAKNINDALNGIAFPDDKQIATLVVRKWYADKENVTVNIAEV